jgi:hypothetical protein
MIRKGRRSGEGNERNKDKKAKMTKGGETVNRETEEMIRQRKELIIRERRGESDERLERQNTEDENKKKVERIK